MTKVIQTCGQMDDAKVYQCIARRAGALADRAWALGPRARRS